MWHPPSMSKFLEIWYLWEEMSLCRSLGPQELVSMMWLALFGWVYSQNPTLVQRSASPILSNHKVQKKNKLIFKEKKIKK